MDSFPCFSFIKWRFDGRHALDPGYHFDTPVETGVENYV